MRTHVYFTTKSNKWGGERFEKKFMSILSLQTVSFLLLPAMHGDRRGTTIHEDENNFT